MNTICLLLCLLALPGADSSLRSSYALAGSNAGQLKLALSRLPAEQRPAAEFLLQNMPAVDLAQMPAPMLEENVALAFKARELLPWGRRVPDELFRHYVLPHRVTQEPLSNWRRMFFDSLYPLVRNCTTMTEAARQVNTWTGRKATYKPNAPRDQGPLQTLLSGWGRCEELVILYADACRAIGIPVRQAYTPYWTAGDGNHAWPEIWIDGQWFPAHAFEAVDSLHFRFKKDTIRTAYVFAVSYGVPENAEGVYRREPGCAVINVTSDYTPTGLLRVFASRSGEVAIGVPVCVSVFNSGALRPVARDTTGDDGWWSIPTGVGEVCVTAGYRSDSCGAIARIVARETTDIRFDLDDPQQLPPKFWLWYPLPEP
ncbi:transglutaminase domain-containing protein [candidate division WOR-3 bacterium]|uniref:Transglutaminase domain-containing protein n=1 Tax=candidate division WOR-3 bacterium TaxID=2052148 RepID=A0A937XFQ7_UNCW3|nr:transglutaminase domain-containing protein [candidate division WOR-3 bacterium]